MDSIYGILNYGVLFVQTASSREGRRSITEATTSLYRHFDKDENLLYVGISIGALTRTRRHQHCSPWFSEIATITVEHYPTRREAMIAESEAVKRENPRHNVALKAKNKSEWIRSIQQAARKRIAGAMGWAF